MNVAGARIDPRPGATTVLTGTDVAYTVWMPCVYMLGPPGSYLPVSAARDLPPVPILR